MVFFGWIVTGSGCVFLQLLAEEANATLHVSSLSPCEMAVSDVVDQWRCFTQIVYEYCNLRSEN